MPRERIRRHGQNDNPKEERKGICKDAYVFFSCAGHGAKQTKLQIESH